MEFARIGSSLIDKLVGDKPKTPPIAWIIVLFIKFSVALGSILLRLIGIGGTVSKHWIPSVRDIRRGYIASVAHFRNLTPSEIHEYFGVTSLEEVAKQLGANIEERGGIEKLSDPAGLQPSCAPYEQRWLVRRPLSPLELIALLRSKRISVPGVPDKIIPYSPFSRSADGGTITRKGTVSGPPECALDVHKFIEIVQGAEYSFAGRRDAHGASAHLRTLALWLASSSETLSARELGKVLVESRAKELHHRCEIFAKFGDVTIATSNNVVVIAHGDDVAELSSDECANFQCKALDLVSDRLYREAQQKKERLELTEHNAPTVPPGMPRVSGHIPIGGVQVVRPGMLRSWMFVPDVGIVKSEEANLVSGSYLEYNGGRIRIRNGNVFIRLIARVGQNFAVSVQWKAKVEYVRNTNADYRDVNKVELEWLLRGSFGQGGIALGLKLLHDNSAKFRCDRCFSQAKSGWFDRRELVEAEIPLRMLHGLMVMIDDSQRFILMPMQHTDKVLRILLGESHLHADYVDINMGDTRLGKLRILDGESRKLS